MTTPLETLLASGLASSRQNPPKKPGAKSPPSSTPSSTSFQACQQVLKETQVQNPGVPIPDGLEDVARALDGTTQSPKEALMMLAAIAGA